ncbi:MAG: glycosyltransferase, exosortase A system-associated, partial [Gammaproteobacteria bacterium]|nr:glycosyltransferase, exosortase A system-associated [Gammaproteobacteria bacterium]
MRILHIFDHSIPLHSGYTFRSRAILEQQRALGWETFHLTSPKHYLESPERETVDGLTFYRTPKSTGVLSRLPIINQLAISSATAKRLEQIIPEIKPDILHAHSPALNGLAALRAGKKFNLPVVYEIRAFWEDAAVDHGTSREGGLRYRLTRRMETHVIKQANAVTTICEGLRRDIIGRGVPDTRVTVIPNAVDISRFSVGAEPDQHLQQELGLAGKQVLGFIGSFYAYEGLPLLLEALPKILEKNPDIRVLLVGGGPDEGKLRTQCVQLNIADKVIFTGRVPHEAVNKYYDLIDILVYPRYSMRLTE